MFFQSGFLFFLPNCLVKLLFFFLLEIDQQYQNQVVGYKVDERIG